jgi:hypothetical protein
MIGGGGPVADVALGFQKKSAVSWLAFILRRHTFFKDSYHSEFLISIYSRVGKIF